MKPFSNWAALVAVSLIFLASCFDPPTYSPIPSIEFDNIIFRDVADPSAVDSLIVSVRFKDGDGDLGLDPSLRSDTLPPFNAKYYYLTPEGTLVTYKTKRTDPRYDTLPAFVKPYNCINWEVRSINKKLDTLYVEMNKDHYNFFVEFYIKNPDGSYRLFDWQTEFANYPSCGETYNGRFPILAKNKDFSQKTPLDGTIRYAMKSTGFLVLFSIKTLKLRITIQDRALNRSNTVETGDFTLQGIKK